MATAIMTIIRILLVIFVIWLVYRLINKTIIASVKKNKLNKPAKMVRCTFCEVYITRTEAYLHDDKFYCSYDHYKKMTSHDKNDQDT
jgi:hypothetical protein